MQRKRDSKWKERNNSKKKEKPALIEALAAIDKMMISNLEIQEVMVMAIIRTTSKVSLNLPEDILVNNNIG